MSKKPLADVPKGDAPAPAAKPVITRQQEEEQDKRLDNLFSDGPITEDEPEPAKPVIPVKEEPESAPKVEPEKKVEPAPDPKGEPPKEKEEGDVDFNAPVAGEDGKTRESAAQVRARENGRALKELQTTHQDTVLELEKVRGELESVKKTVPVQVDELSIHERPECQEIRKKVGQDRDALAFVQKGKVKGVVSENFGSYLGQLVVCQAETDPVKAEELENQLRATITDDFKKAYRGSAHYQEEREESLAEKFEEDLMTTLVRNVNHHRQYTETVQTLLQKAKEGTLATGVEEYARQEADLLKAAAAVTELSDEVIEENPHTVEATVASLIAKPEYRKRFDAATKKVLEAFLGPRVLSQKDLDNMKASGVDVKKFMKDRQTVYLDRRRKLMAMAVQGLVLRSEWEALSRDAEAYRSMKSERKGLNGGKDKPIESVKVEKKPGDSRYTLDQYESAVDEVFA